MGRYPLTRPTIRVSSAILTAFLVLLFHSQAYATSVGTISGSVTDTASGAPLFDVAVTAVSGSGDYTAKTNVRGFYSMSGVYADTYTVSFSLHGYQLHTELGVTVIADQIATVSVKLARVVTTLGKVVVHGEASAFQPTQTTPTVTVDAAQIQNLQGSSFNISESQLITSLPGAMSDSSGYPVIHGGREYEEGFEFEGIPYVDAYSNQFNNSLAIPTAGIQLVQLTPGTGDASQAGGGVGMFNVVAKRGTYPGYIDAGTAVGGPGYDHRLNVDVSWATPSGRVSDYISFAGAGSRFEQGCCNYPATQLGDYYGTEYESDQETLNNFVYRFGNNNNQSLQFFADVAQHDFFTGIGGLNGLCFVSCDAVYDSTWAGIYGMTPTQVQNMSALYPEQNTPFQLLSQWNRYPGTYWQPNQAMKLEYTDNLSQSTYLSVKYYRTNSVVTFDFPSTEGGFYGDAYIEQGGQTTGGTVSIQSQLNDKNLFEFGSDYAFLHPIDSYRSDSYGLYGALLGFYNNAPDIGGTPWQFIPPGQSCPDPVGPCGYAYNYTGAPAQLTYPQFDQIASVNRLDYSLFADDKMDISRSFKAELGLREDMATYLMPTPGVNPTFCTTLYLPATWTPNPKYNSSLPLGNGNCPDNATYNFTSQETAPKILQPRVGFSWQATSNTAVRLTYDRAVQFVPIASVDYGEIDPRYYFNQPYSNLPAINQFGVTNQCGFYGYLVPCRTFGEQLYWAAQNFDGIAFQPALPMTSDNYQINFQTQFTKGILNGVAVSIAPWYRFQHNTSANEAAPVLGPNGLPEVIDGQILTYPPVLKTNGKEFATGIDLNVTREIAYGLTGQFTGSYINEFSSVIPTSSSEDYYPNIPPASLLLGNEYRVGFVSPFQTTLGLTYKTPTGWRINPRIYYNIGYPTDLGTLTSALINGTAYNLPNTNALIGDAPNGPACFVDPMNPGSLFAPNIAACRGNAESASPGGKLSPANTTGAITIEYTAPRSQITYGADVENLFGEIYDGVELNGRYQPIATGITGPLTGYSTNPVDYTNYPSAWPQYAGYIRGNQLYLNIPGNYTSWYFYVQAKT
jgi:Carboxypeptidase regulatory-like domain